jgi:hypothetical protein
MKSLTSADHRLFQSKQKISLTNRHYHHHHHQQQQQQRERKVSIQKWKKGTIF